MTQLSPKSLRMSATALTAAVMATVWAIADSLTDGQMNAVIVSSVTSLVMLVAQFIDWRATKLGAEVFKPSSEDDDGG